MQVEKVDFVSVLTQDLPRAKEGKGFVFDGETIVTDVCKQAWFKDPDGNALMLHRRFDV